MNCSLFTCLRLSFKDTFQAGGTYSINHIKTLFSICRLFGCHLDKVLHHHICIIVLTFHKIYLILNTRCSSLLYLPSTDFFNFLYCFYSWLFENKTVIDFYSHFITQSYARAAREQLEIRLTPGFGPFVLQGH